MDLNKFRCAQTDHQENIVSEEMQYPEIVYGRKDVRMLGSLHLG